MDTLILFLLPKGIAAVYIWDAVTTYRRALRKGRVEAYHYWWLGFALYNFATYVTWGWLLQIQVDLFWFCLGGYLTSMAISIYQDSKKRKEYNKAREAAIAEVEAQMDALAADMVRRTQERDELQAHMYDTEAQISQLGKERSEVISALDLIESWQTLPNEEFVARQSEIEASLISMEMRNL